MPGFQELLVIGVVALLVFGPDRLPEVARTVGRGLGRLRAETQRNVDEFRRLAEIEDLERELRGLRNELTTARDDVGRHVRDAAGLPATTPVTGRDARPRVRLRADDDPPPADPEAT